MARKKSPTLTEAELRLMEILWEKGRASVAEVVEALPREVPLAYSTVLTTLRILEQKGYLHHRTQGRAFIYQPVVDRGKARRSALRHLVERFFDNSPELLVQHLLEQKALGREELQRLKRRIAASK